MQNRLGDFLSLRRRRERARVRAKRHLHQISKVVLVDELAIALRWFQQRKNKTDLILCRLTQYSKDSAGNRDCKYRVNQRRDPTFSPRVIKKRETRGQSEHLKRKEARLIRIGADVFQTEKPATSSEPSESVCIKASAESASIGKRSLHPRF